jgi:hypothetical protein
LRPICSLKHLVSVEMWEDPRRERRGCCFAPAGVPLMGTFVR